jgi:hypothetical protein
VAGRGGREAKAAAAALASESAVNEPAVPSQTEPSKFAIHEYIAKVCDGLWALFELLPRTEQGKTTEKREWGFKGAVELKDYRPNGFLNHLLCCVQIFYHFNWTKWNPAYLTEDEDAVLTMLDHPTHGIRYHLKEIQDKNLTSEVSLDIREGFEKWSAYVLSWLDENQVLLQRLHAAFEESMETKRK